MATPATKENVQPKFSIKKMAAAMRDIMAIDADTLSAKNTFAARHKRNNDKIKQIKRDAKEEGLNIETLNELLMRRKAAQAQVNRTKKMSQDARKQLDQSKSLQPKAEQLSMFKEPEGVDPAVNEVAEKDHRE